MPTNRSHGGAALQPINLVTPAFNGLNTENEASILGPEWATTLNNAIFDEAGRIAARKGWASQTSTPATGTVKRLFEYIRSDTTEAVISITSTDILLGTSAPASIKNAGVTVANSGNIMGQNFNNKFIFFNNGIVVYDPTASVTADALVVNSGTAPTGLVGMCAYGRVWGVDTDGVTLKWSALLDETRWDVADGAGYVDMSQVWPQGQDRVKALAEFNGDIIVFGERNIVFFTDGAGSAFGPVPDDMYVADALQGMGAVTQFGVTHVEGDLWCLTQHGIVALRRLVAERSNPQVKISETVNSALLLSVGAETADDLTLLFHPEEQFALLTLPTSGLQYYFDSEGVAQTGKARTTTWTSPLQTIMTSRDGYLYGAFSTIAGEVLLHTGNSDDGSSYAFDYESGWLDFGVEATQYYKFMKKIGSVVFVESTTTIEYTLAYDFSTNERSFQANATGGVKSEWNIAEFSGYRIPAEGASSGPAEFGGGIDLRVIPVPAAGGGQFVRVGITVNTENARFAVQQLTLFARIGRIA